MKSIKYIALAAALVFSAAACQKHVIEFNASETVTSAQAQFQIIYAEPITVSNANRIDSVFVNGKLYNSIKMPQTLTVNGIIPYPNGYYVAPAGTINLKFFRGKQDDGSSKLVYEKDIVLQNGKYQVILYGMDKDLIILDDEYPYVNHSIGATADTFDTDSLVSYRFINMLHNADGTPYTGKLQYQYSNNSGSSYTAGDWHNLGEPIGFGQQTTRNCAIVHKTVFNSSGSQTLRFRCVDPETGTPVSGTNDYWTAYIGRVNTHMLRGRRGGSPASGYSQYINNVQ
jgi:hypothetical protein